MEMFFKKRRKWGNKSKKRQKVKKTEEKKRKKREREENRENRGKKCNFLGKKSEPLTKVKPLGLLLNNCWPGKLLSKYTFPADGLCAG